MASAAALANTLGVPASARVTTQPKRKNVRHSRGGAIRAMAEADESPVFRAWDQATHSNKRTDIKKIMIIGAGPIVIGQACEFDYSGTQACKSLRCVAKAALNTTHICVNHESNLGRARSHCSRIPFPPLLLPSPLSLSPLEKREQK